VIRHRPAGSGHPYEPDDECRIPFLPLAGEPVEIRATAPAAVTGLTLELEDGRRWPMIDAGGDGRRRRWRVEMPGFPAGVRVAYRIVPNDGSRPTRRHVVEAGDWAKGGSVSATRGAGRWEIRPHGRSEQPPSRLAQDSLTWLWTGSGVHRVRFGLRLDRGQRVIGLGERYDRLDQRGNRLDVRVYEPYKRQWDGSRTYLPMPFFIAAGGSEPGWAAWVATSRRVWFDLGASEPGWIMVEADVDPHDPVLAVEIYGGSPREVLAAFLARSGPTAVPPDWAFRPWMSANEWNSQARVMSEVERSAELDIPVGVLVIEAWSDETSFTIFRDASYEPRRDGGAHRLSDFSFPPDGAWPDPRGMVDALHDRGIRLLLWQIPLMKRRRDLTDQAIHDWDRMIRDRYGVMRRGGRPYRNRGWWFPDALLVDFTSAAARDWWLAKRRYLVEELGVDGFKTDGGEHAWGDDLRYADGRSGAEVNNEYPVLYQAAYHDLLRQHRADGLTFSRAGFVGSGRYPAFWAGDEDSTWEAFRAAIVAGQHAGSSGIFFWGWDIGGFSGEIPTAELYLRSTAMACFCPIMQYHAEHNAHRLPSRDRTPWNIAERTGDERAITLYRRFAALRDRLVPYLSREARSAAETAVPLMRPLAFDEPSDNASWAASLQYRLGRDLVVAPVTEPDARTWSVYLPAGEWVDLWTGELLAGESSTERGVPLDIIPVYVRAETAGQLRAELGLTR
jgi:1,3-alpha-isomaltosidase